MGQIKKDNWDLFSNRSMLWLDFWAGINFLDFRLYGNEDMTSSRNSVLIMLVMSGLL